MENDKVENLKKLLNEAYPEVKTELIYETPFQLLVATILSAQTTDKQVNKITGPLFKSYPTPETMFKLTREEMEEKIKHLGLYRHKSRHLLEVCGILINKYHGEVPRKREELMSLPGVGRKTANVVLANAFGIPAFAVDTHVGRVSRRLGLTKREDPLGVEEDLCKIFLPEDWYRLHHQFIFHGRKYCTARSPRCSECFLYNICPSNNKSSNHREKVRKGARK